MQIIVEGKPYCYMLDHALQLIEEDTKAWTGLVLDASPAQWRGWRERVGIEPTGPRGATSVAILKIGRDTSPDPLPERS
jgi:hypothetical protein